MQHHKERWQSELSESISTVEELLNVVQLSEKNLAIDARATETFALRVPKPFAARIQPGNPNDPLLRQVLPLRDELLCAPGYSTDPLQEKQANKTPGLLHKYFGRVLLILTGACAINCRYCFRRHFPYQENSISKQQLNNIVNYIEKEKDIYEVILSGGDPLMLKDQTLESLLNKLDKIKQLKYLRIHTRLPIMIPSRITDKFIALLTQTRLIPNVVLHCNHAQEIDDEVASAIRKMRKNHITVLNQSVLLKNINDKADTLIALSHTLYQCGALPYYLHMLDATAGTQHFAVTTQQAQQLMLAVRAKLPGFLVPKLVREIPEENSKVAV